MLDILDEVLVIDQGTQKVTDNENYAEAAAALGPSSSASSSRPTCSGGFSRAMNEAVSRGASDGCPAPRRRCRGELEGVLRAVTFADLAKQPTLARWADVQPVRPLGDARVRRDRRGAGFWGPAPHTATTSPSGRCGRRWLHRRVDVDYNGWWMCLIPTSVIKEIGLSPMFIKWDDAEFGCGRARRIPTVTMPGVAVWHVPWTEKDDTLDWQAYFHERNRLVSGLLHSPYDRGGRLALESLENHAKRMVSMQYGTGETILLALNDVLAVRSACTVTCPSASRRSGTSARSLRRQGRGARRLPAPRREKPPRKGRAEISPQGPAGKVKMAAVGLLRQVRPVRRLASKHPEGIIPHVDQRWVAPAQFDSAIVSLRRRGTDATRGSSRTRWRARRSCTPGCTGSGRAWPRGTGRRCPAGLAGDLEVRRSRASTTTSTGSSGSRVTPSPQEGAPGRWRRDVSIDRGPFAYAGQGSTSDSPARTNLTNLRFIGVSSGNYTIVVTQFPFRCPCDSCESCATCDPSPHWSRRHVLKPVSSPPVSRCWRSAWCSPH